MRYDPYSAECRVIDEFLARRPDWWACQGLDAVRQHIADLELLARYGAVAVLRHCAMVAADYAGKAEAAQRELGRAGQPS